MRTKLLRLLNREAATERFSTELLEQQLRIASSSGLFAQWNTVREDFDRPIRDLLQDSKGALSPIDLLPYFERVQARREMLMAIATEAELRLAELMALWSRGENEIVRAQPELAGTRKRVEREQATLVYLLNVDLRWRAFEAIRVQAVASAKVLSAAHACLLEMQAGIHAHLGTQAARGGGTPVSGRKAAYIPRKP